MKPGFGNIETISRSGGSLYWTPQTPTNFLVSSIEDGNRLTWEYNYGNKDGFEVWVSINGAGYVILIVVEANITTYDDLVSTGVLAYKVNAFKDSTHSEFSDEQSITRVALPTGVTSSFIVDTILGKVDWTDNSSGIAQYEIWSATNNAAKVLLTTTATGVTTYNDTTCKQNASVVYSICAKIDSSYSSFVVATSLVTPLCFKTDQSTLVNVVINRIDIVAGKTINIDWGDDTNADYAGSNTDITKTYSATGQYNIKISGDTDSITYFKHWQQVKSHGDITNWILPSGLTWINVYQIKFTGTLTNTIIPVTMISFGLGQTNITGLLPNITPRPSGSCDYYMVGDKFSGTNISTFSKGLSSINISSQAVSFPTSEVDKFLKAAADWYQVNAPTPNCTYTLNGANMGIPTGGNDNVDIVRLKGYYIAAGKIATVTVRTS